MVKSRSLFAAMAMSAAGVLSQAAPGASSQAAAGVLSQAAAGAAPAAQQQPSAAVKPAPALPQVLLGPVTRQQVEAAAPAWVQAGVEAKPDLGAAHALAAVEPGAEVTVLLGTWCSD